MLTHTILHSRRSLTSFATSLASRQGHIDAAAHVGVIYYAGQGAPVDHPRAMTSFKVAAEGDDALCQYQVGTMYCNGLGVDVDYAQALPWLEKAAAQDNAHAVCRLGSMYFEGKGVTPSWRRALGFYERAIELGDSIAAENMQTLTGSIQEVTSQPSNHFTPPSVLRDLTLLSAHSLLPSHSRSTPPSWTSGWRSTARAART